MQAIYSTGKPKPTLLWAGIVLLLGLAGCASKAHLGAPPLPAPPEEVVQKAKDNGNVNARRTKRLFCLTNQGCQKAHIH